jgi:hypothetical protein
LWVRAQGAKGANFLPPSYPAAFCVYQHRSILRQSSCKYLKNTGDLLYVWFGTVCVLRECRQSNWLCRNPNQRQKDEQMKTIALSMIVSLAVILCEQQTLFAALPIYTNVASSLIPIAGADSLNVSKAIAAPQTYGLNPGGTSLMYEQGTRMHDSGERLYPYPTPRLTPTNSREPIRDVDHQDEYDHIHGDEDQPFDYDLGPIDDNGAFLPWHRGYISSKTGRN